MRPAVFVSLVLLVAAPQERPVSNTRPDSQTLPLHGSQRTQTRHLVLTTSSRTQAASPGTRVALFIDVTPKPGMHVYAPGQKELIPISLSLEKDESYAVHPAQFPEAEKYFFEPLGETQLVYSKPFRIVQEVTLASTPALQARAAERQASITIAGTVRYQACDDMVCYMPQTLPVSWRVPLKR